MNILVTGAAGYIGSHTLVELLGAGHSVVALDNFSNSRPEALHRVVEITGCKFPVYEIDLRDGAQVRDVLASHSIDAVIHFAGLKSVGESVDKPRIYYSNNLVSTITLLDAMAARGCRSLVFSSSATVYGNPVTVPITEDAALSATNPYGRTKLMIEEMLRDVAKAEPEWRIALLRYFNPVGAHPSGRIGEDPRGVPNNLFPFIAQVAVGRRSEVLVFGDDYPTRDGTGMRDYLHVCDLAGGHLRAVECLSRLSGAVPINLGTGQGTTVFEAIGAFGEVSARPIPYRVVPRRAGDVASCYADASRARRLLGWTAQRGLPEMCADTWRWQSANPSGYASG